MMKRNFYDILNVAPSATLEELKSNYKHLILQCHPDKLLQQQQQQQQQQQLLHGSNADKLENDLNNEEFVAITEAWNCLKDPSKRKQYDAELLLNKFHTHNNIYAHIQLSEMKKCLSTDVVELADDGEEGAADADEGIKSDSNKESSSSSSLPSYFYTYDCRCGGQYIVDESAEQYCRKVNSTADAAVVGGDDDDADITQNNNSPNKTAGYNNDDGGAVNGGRHRVGGTDGSVGSSKGGGGGGVAFHEDIAEDDSDGELIVECSECSLVIILNG